MLPAASSFMLRISFLLGPEAKESWATLARHWASQSSSAEMYSWHWQLWERTGSVSGSVRPRGPLQRDVSCLSWGCAFRGEPEVTGPHTLMPCSCTGWGISQDESHAWDENVVLGVGGGRLSTLAWLPAGKRDARANGSAKTLLFIFLSTARSTQCKGQLAV